MVSLVKRKGSDNWYYRRTIPADVGRILEMTPKERGRHPGWYRIHIMISTGMPVRADAKTIDTDIAANVERRVKALRAGPKALTTKQVSILSGVAYRAFAEGLENNPGLTSGQWLRVAEANDLARCGQFGLGARLGIFKDEDERRDVSMEHRFGGIVDATLIREGVVTDDESRWKLIEAVSRDLTEAAKKLARNADGDYSPDNFVSRFPPHTDLKDSPAHRRVADWTCRRLAHRFAGPRNASARCKALEGGRASIPGMARP